MIKTKSIILLILLPLLFISFHYFVYLGNYKSPFDGNEFFSDWFILVSFREQSLDVENLVLKETILPDYINPFRKIEYRYSEKNQNEIVLIEQGSIFSSDMEIIKGDLKKYFNSETDGPFAKGFGAEEYPNTLFFLVQYFIAGLFIFETVKTIRTLK